ncbi:carbohydrate ABC transporter permease [Treponema zuelzerae]|uniref:sn-glycerol-3-phosphate transport system permease protein UgpE n=1 Tax=Teretinema zuelzerae TaxID=156 RepID=A0AAE3EK84_9SPIR|nr:carbohydrate ABC transporter permease [Teretinema zuelzerae]MCD1655860.1 carbohydrate ABC transporter permease [Teretinema zuelzerae]HPO01702.1 carbohydrate ABC transporter permease [Treponemataceae bacterium]
MKTNRMRLHAGRTLSLAALSALLVLMLFPFFIVFINAFKTAGDYAQNGPLAMPETWTAAAIKAFWNRVKFGGKLWNSFYISASVAVLASALSMLNSFALGIGKIKGAVGILILFVVANTLPQEVLVYPLYYLAKSLGIYDRQLAVIIIFTVVQSAFGTYLLSSAYSAFPRELIEAATVDGCSKTELLVNIVAPMSKATISVLFTFFFLWTWNEFFIPLIMLVSNSRQTVPIAISVTQGQHNMDATMASASALLGILPCIVFFILFQRTLSRGITAGAIK